MRFHLKYMNNERVQKTVFILFLVLVFSTLFVSCSFFKAVGEGIKSLFIFLGKSVLFVGGGTLAIWVLVEEGSDSRGALYASYLFYLVSALGFCLYFETIPVTVLIIAAIGNACYIGFGKAWQKPLFFWVTALPLFALIFYLTGFMHYIVQTADVEFIFWIILAASAVLALIPAMLSLLVPIQKKKAKERKMAREQRKEEEEKMDRQRALEEKIRRFDLKIAEIHSGNAAKK